MRTRAVIAAVTILGAVLVPAAPAAGQAAEDESFFFCSLPLDGQIKAGQGWSDLLPEFHLRHFGTPPTLSAQFDPLLAFLPEWAVPDLQWLTTSFEDDGLVVFGRDLAQLAPVDVDVVRGLLWIPAAGDVEAFGVAVAALTADDIVGIVEGTPGTGTSLLPYVEADDLPRIAAVIGGVDQASVRQAGEFLAALPFRSVDPLRQVLSGIEVDQVIEMGRLLGAVTPT